MGLMQFFSRFSVNPGLMDRMFSKFGVRDSFAELPHGPEVLRRATLRCASCSEAGDCASWLDANAAPAEAPAYCRNHDLIERLRHLPAANATKTG